MWDSAALTKYNNTSHRSMVSENKLWCRNESQGIVTAETIQTAFRSTEEGFTAMVTDLWNTRPQVATTGMCCLVGVIFQQTLFVANLGDSRVVLGKKVGNTGGVAAIQLSTEHNANLEAVRHELKELHPHDPQIVVLKHGVWRVKGIIQVNFMLLNR
ncbi:probable protein phosphatase 2C 42 [Vicia villosa]|uniref:probable protein phosphatase 2C 42 n=1 Tax=Vicia villosa TaxID=3911 RepID=UPI00273B6DBA|nr:probable protein phosphatase 2C 42 [Vicia villosa]